MSQAISYLSLRFIVVLKEFLEHWYVRSFVRVSHYMLDLFEELDKSFALRVSFRNLFKPLYQDRSFIGHILGFIFRSIRIGVALVVYGFLFALSGLIYLAWLLLPPFLIYKAFLSYGS